jgi:lipopolysaccharide transport system ATP-binding protein
MSKPIIKVENLSKAYQIGQIGTGTISRDIERFWLTKVLGKEDPFLKIGETNDKGIKGESDIVWSLRDINFEINQGDAVGIIGKNGAGKSTLLKLLSRVTGPTTGEIKVKGRIASLLEVGTGFHPELSGRENIYLNGAILGMRKKEITRKLDEIIDFSGVERYIDTPVKRYSSGMYVRLAFAVAAHLESEILIVDEVLAVGDAEFQKKCLGKMGDISKGQGRTVLFVSHNMAAVKSLCTKGIVLENGSMVYNGSVTKSIEYYTDIFSKNFNREAIHKDYSNKIEILSSSFKSNDKTITSGAILLLGDTIKIDLSILTKDYIDDLSIAIDIVDKNGELMSHLTNEDDGLYFSKSNKNEYKFIEIETANLLFIPGAYLMNIWFGVGQRESLYEIKNFFSFEMEQSDFTKRTKALPSHSKVYLPSSWKVTEK